MIKPGKKTKAWNTARAKLKKDFYKAGITRCEINFSGCTNAYALSFAHIDKRRYLSDEELYAVVLSCQNCHQKIEKWQREMMRNYLEDIIKRRNERI